MTIETQLREAAARAETDSRLLHEIVHGDAATAVTTEGGAVKSAAKAIGDVETAVAGAATTVTEGVAQAETARDEAVAARDAVENAVRTVAVSATDITPAALSAKLEAGRGLEAVIENAGADESLALSVTPQLNAGALIALAEAFI